MKKPKIPAIIVAFVLVILVPVLAGEYLIYQKVVEQAEKTNSICLKPVLVENIAEVTPTATPSPTLKPAVRLVPATPATGGGK